jgi:tetratricopeptide (TPR) repeat protein
MNKVLLLFLIALLILLSACSAIPKKIVPQSKVLVGQFLEQAHKEELKANYIDALSIYQEAEKNAVLYNDLNLQLVCLQGQARIHYLNADTTSYQLIVKKMDNLIQSINPRQTYHLIQIRFWEYFRTGNYELIADTDFPQTQLPRNVKIELLSYKLQAHTRLKQPAAVEHDLLSKEISGYLRKYKHSKNMQAELISNAYYALAYYEAGKTNFPKAIIWLKKAIKLDRDYDLYLQLADDYALMGEIYKRMQNQSLALAYFTIASQIYEKSNHQMDANRIASQIESIRQENK